MKESSDLWLLTASLRFTWGMVIWGIFLLVSPPIAFSILVFGIRFMSRDEIDLTKVLLVVIGPFALVFWWIIVRHVTNNSRAKRLIVERSQTGDDYSAAELVFLEQVGKPLHLCNFIVLIVSFAGSVYGAHLVYSSGDWQFFVGVLAGIFSPVIMMVGYRLLQRFI